MQSNLVQRDINNTTMRFLNLSAFDLEFTICIQHAYNEVSCPCVYFEFYQENVSGFRIAMVSRDIVLVDGLHCYYASLF